MFPTALQSVEAAWLELGRLLWGLFLLPGTYCVHMVLEMAPEYAGGLASLEPDAWPLRLFSVAVWLVVAWVLARLWALVRDVDRALTSWIVDCRDTAARRLRVSKRLLIYTLERIWRRPEEPQWAIARTIELDAVELALLRAQLLLVPDSVATPRDLAAGHAISARQARHILHRLAKLGLVESDRTSGVEGYRLTPYGKLFLGSLGAEHLAAGEAEPEREPHRARLSSVRR